VPQTPEPISAVSGPKFTILSGHVEELLLLNKFLANVNSRSRSLYAIARPSVCLSVCLSVTLVHPTQAVEIFGNISAAFGTLAIRWHPGKNLAYGDRPRGTPLAGELNARGIAKYSDFGPIEAYISETVQCIGGKLVLIIGSRIWGFDSYQNRWPWMTLNGAMALILRYVTEFSCTMSSQNNY